MTTALTRACAELEQKHPGVFKPDEVQRTIGVGFPLYKTNLHFKPYTDKASILKKMRECAKENDKREKIEALKHQGRLI